MLTPTEQKIARVWTDVLKCAFVGVDENFFGLGGDSMSAIQALFRVGEIFGFDVTLAELFENPTIRLLSIFIEEKLDQGSRATVSAMRTVPGNPHPLLSLQQESRLLSEAYAARLSLPRLQHSNLVMLVLNDEPDVAACQRALDSVVSRHEVLGTGLSSRDLGQSPDMWLTEAERFPFGQSLFEADFRAELRCPLDFLDAGKDGSDEKINRFASEFVRAQFDYQSPPLMRAALVRSGSERHVLLVAVPHIVADRWSLGILHSDIRTIYGAITRADSHSLPAPPVQYADYASAQRNRLSRDDVENALSYWKSCLQGEPLISWRQLPFAASRSPRALPGSHVVESYTLDSELCATVKRFLRRHQMTLHALVWVGLAILLNQYTGQARIGLWTFLANRPHSSLRRVVGDFATPIVLTLDIAHDTAIVDLLAQARRRLSEALRFQDIPFGVVRPHLLGLLGKKGYEALNFDVNSEAVSSSSSAQIERFSFEREGTGGLKLRVIDRRHEIELRLAYGRDAFDTGGVRQMLLHLHEVLRLIVTSPDVTASRFFQDFSVVSSLPGRS